MDPEAAAHLNYRTIQLAKFRFHTQQNFCRVVLEYICNALDRKTLQTTQIIRGHAQLWMQQLT